MEQTYVCIQMGYLYFIFFSPELIQMVLTIHENISFRACQEVPAYLVTLDHEVFQANLAPKELKENLHLLGLGQKDKKVNQV